MFFLLICDFNPNRSLDPERISLGCWAVCFSFVLDSNTKRRCCKKTSFATSPWIVFCFDLRQLLCLFSIRNDENIPSCRKLAIRRISIFLVSQVLFFPLLAGLYKIRESGVESCVRT